MRDVVSQNVDLVRWQAFEHMTAELLERLVREAEAQAREAAATAGYFDAKVDARIDRASQPVVVTLTVVPGEPARVASVAIDVAGDAARSPQGAPAIATLRDEWLLPRGAVWTQSAWNDAKRRVLVPLAEGPWAAARIERSEARIDPGKASADLSVAIDSGPAFRFGAIQVRGLSRYDAALVEGFNTIEPGTPYRAADVDQLARRLARSGYFSSVHAAIDPDPAKADSAPVDVAVIEGRTKKFEAGFGYSTDTQFRVNASYSDVDVDGRATQFYADGRIEQKLQSASVRVVRPPTPTHWQDTYAAAWLRTDIENLITTTSFVSVRRAAVEERDQWQFGGGFWVDEQRPLGADAVRSHALYGDVQRTWRRTDDLVSPTRGYNVEVVAGGGVPGASTRGFARVVARFAAWHPLGRDTDFSTRATAGAVFAQARDGIPSTFLFRTGGDTTVRGYAFESIGVAQGEATVPGRYELVASAEVTHWVRPALGVAVFVDAGNATDTPSDVTSVKVGYGIGARVKTPVGPFRLDLAYGQQTQSFRLHFSVGLTF